jgi:hypothetical protein
VKAPEGASLAVGPRVGRKGPPRVVMSIRAAEVDRALVTVVPHDPRAGVSIRSGCLSARSAMRHPIAGTGTYSFEIASCRIRAIYVVRNPDKLRGFLEHTL